MAEPKEPISNVYTLLAMHREAVMRDDMYNERTATLLGFAAALCDEVEWLKAKVERCERNERG